MHELSCPSCNASTQYELKNYLLMCPFCSATFAIDMQTGRKDIHVDHFIIPNAIDSTQVRDIVLRWLKRMHMDPKKVDKEYIITDIKGYSIPYWIVSLEAHTVWKGLVKRQKTPLAEFSPSTYILESGQFRRSYRWAISARRNICEHWDLVQLHEPKEPVRVTWDGFPLDSTFSRGRIDASTGVKTSKENLEGELPAYSVREYFEFKYSNGLPILDIEVPDEEALRRAKQHVERYHSDIARFNVDIPIDVRSELEIASVQLVHLPFWHIRYTYRPTGALRIFQKFDKKNVVMEGYSGGILKSELAIIQEDKIRINAMICLIAAAIAGFLGLVWHPAFALVMLFFLCVSGVSFYLAIQKKQKKEEEELPPLNHKTGKSPS